MYRWPWRRFEGMFRRHLLRKAREELRQIRDLRLAALDANMNYDSKDNQDAKRQMREGLQESYEEGLRILQGGAADPAVPDQSYEDDPLFSRTARERLNESARPLVAEAGMGRQLLEAS